MTGSSWAILRQVVVATTDHDGDLAAVRQAFGFGPGFEDAQLADFHMLDATMPVSKDSYLEFVAPTDDQAAMAPWLTRIGGRGGYVLSVQHPDPAGVKARALAAGIRIPVELEVFGNHVMQLHPKDVGLLLEIDGITDRDTWFWDDINPGPEPDATVDEIIGVSVPVADPVATATQWRELLDLGAQAAPDTVQLGGPWVRFVPGGPSAAWTVVLRRAAGATVTAPVLPGVSFELV